MPKSRDSRSRSRSRERRRSRSRSRSRSRDRDRRRRRRSRSRSRSRDRRPRSRSRSRERRRSRSRSRSRDRDRRRLTDDRRRNQDSLSRPKAADEEEVVEFQLIESEITAEDLEGKDDDELKMLELMGFGSFDSTKGKRVVGNDHYAANITRKRRYRQYMNRRGGFNRPLDFIA